MRHLTTAELEAGLAHVRRAPGDAGILEMIVRRPVEGEREVVDEAALDVDKGLAGDDWHARGWRRRPEEGPNPATQLTLMNARFVDLIAGSPERWPLAGDQLYVDLDLSGANLPPGTRLRIGTAVVEVSEAPHTGCGKFVRRFGADARRFANSEVGRRLNLRGINARVVESGTVRRGDTVTKN